MPLKKPPLGLMPQYIHDELRLKDIREAIIRYLDACMDIPIEWIEEYNEINRRLKERDRVRKAESP